MTFRLMADTTDHSAPAGYDIYAGYDDGGYQSYPFLKADFPSAIVLRITVFAHDVFGHALDCEKGDATPAQAPGWIIAQGKKQFRIWVADYGVAHCPFSGASAWQKIDHGPHGENIDVSEVYSVFFGVDGIPIIYCPFSDLQAVLDACHAAGLTLVTPVNETHPSVTSSFPLEDDMPTVRIPAPGPNSPKLPDGRPYEKGTVATLPGTVGLIQVSADGFPDKPPTVRKAIGSGRSNGQFRSKHPQAGIEDDVLIANWPANWGYDHSTPFGEGFDEQASFLNYGPGEVTLTAVATAKASS